MSISSIDLSPKPQVSGFFDNQTNTISYIVRDPNSASCAIYDAVMEFDQAAGRLTFEGADRLIDHIRENNLKLEWIIETHEACDAGHG